MGVAEAAPLAAPALRPWWRGRVGLVLAVVLGMGIAFMGWGGEVPWPGGRAGGGRAPVLHTLVGWLTSFFYKLTWVGTVAFGVLIVLRFGGRRAALGVLAAFFAFAAMGLWQPTVQTFALTLASVGLSLAVRPPPGSVGGPSDRFQRAITPVLDAMQIIPAFAYLMPIVLLFSVGPGAAVVTTMIYSIPPAIRITALGIRGVPANTVEAALAMGSTPAQT